MANTIIIKKSSVPGKVPAAGDLVYGELAINYADAKIYFKRSDNTISSFTASNPTAASIDYTPATAGNWNPVPTTVKGALDTLATQVPPQTGNSGKYLTTDGTTTSWATVSGTGSVTSVAASTTLTGLSFSGSPITSSGTLSLTGTLGVASGGTGAIDAAGARTNLSAAASGANSDITSITGLTTALTIAQGGTGSTTAGAAFTSLAPAQVGQTGKYLTTDGNSASWANIPLTPPAGNNNELQFNNNGAFGSSSGLTWANSTLSATNISTGSAALTHAGITSAVLVTTTTTADQVVDSVSVSLARTVKYLVQVTSGSEYQCCEILVIHNGTDAYLTTYGLIHTSVSPLATFDAQINGGNLQLLVTPENSTNTIKVLRTSINT